jgi:hypothetical protein
MITDLIVWASVVFTVAGVAAWAASPALREWIERPKHRFLESAQQYDATTHPRATGSGHARRGTPTEPQTP